MTIPKEIDEEYPQETEAIYSELDYETCQVRNESETNPNKGIQRNISFQYYYYLYYYYNFQTMQREDLIKYSSYRDINIFF